MNLKKCLHGLLLFGMGLMIPCYAFTVLNVTLSPWPLYDRSRKLLVLLTAACIALLLLALRASDRHEAFFARQVYFPGKDDVYKAFKAFLKNDIDEEEWESVAQTTSRPFPRPRSGQIAVKVINHFGDEVMKVFRIE